MRLPSHDDCHLELLLEGETGRERETILVILAELSQTRISRAETESLLL